MLLVALLISVCVFVVVFEALAPSADAEDDDGVAYDNDGVGDDDDDDDGDDEETQRHHSSPLNVRLVDLLRESLGIDAWLESDRQMRLARANDNVTEAHASPHGDGEHDEAMTDDVSATGGAAWRALSDDALRDEPERMLIKVFSWTVDDLARWLRLVGINETLVVHVRTQMIGTSMPALEFIAKRHADLVEMMDSAEDVQSLAMANAMIRAFARQEIAIQQATQLLAGDGDSLWDFVGDDFAAVLVSAAHFLFRVISFLVKFLIAALALLFFGPEGVGLALLRWSLRAFVWIMGILTPLIQRVFPRFRIRVVENNA
jgi:hypothetical protein